MWVHLFSFLWDSEYRYFWDIILLQVYVLVISLMAQKHKLVGAINRNKKIWEREELMGKIKWGEKIKVLLRSCVVRISLNVHTGNLQETAKFPLNCLVFHTRDQVTDFFSLPNIVPTNYFPLWQPSVIRKFNPSSGVKKKILSLLIFVLIML